MKKKLTEKDIENILEENKKLKEENKRLHQILDCVKKNIQDYEDAAKARRLDEIRPAYIDTGEGLAGKLKLKITDLPLKIRTMNLLKVADCDTLGDIVTKDKSYFMQFRSFGTSGIYDIMNVLELYGLDFGMDVK